ncbi:Zinc finger, RING/FYVE/PHD-type [Lasallia pustulata]|uniref:Zinc finger, RING/FYVE/PHD-type n=1 Tax=Lasallia pustulata TaxID=136370 RepID=A0A1W5DAP7_9LECA|nr:Zinc finger, RING/FYVE/PHD-type [Lasallia pustulata]
MPPRSSLTSSFSVSDANNEVVCPLTNHDGTNCRKRCLGEKRYRSMQEHIRRAHPEHYISKLPATEESFQLMINTPPSERPAPPPTQPFNAPVYGHDRDGYYGDTSSAARPRTLEEAYPAAATAAVALAQLHNHRPDSDRDSENDYHSDVDSKQPRMHSSVELPPIQHPPNQDLIPPFQSPRPRELLPSMLARSPPGRSSTLPPVQRTNKPARPRKSSITTNSRKAKHERTKAKDHARRMSIEGRKAFSAEPQSAATVMGKRWEDLIEAATSANEADSDRDLTPIPQSPPSIKRASLPPFLSSVHHFDHYKASPLQHALTPPPPSDAAEPFPSVESSIESQQSGQKFHMPSSGLTISDSSPTFSQPVQIYCAACHRASVLKDSFACTECISGFCQDCVYALTSEQNRGRVCPRCQAVGGRYKPFQLDLR